MLSRKKWRIWVSLVYAEHHCFHWASLDARPCRSSRFLSCLLAFLMTRESAYGCRTTTRDHGVDDTFHQVARDIEVQWWDIRILKTQNEWVERRRTEASHRFSDRQQPRCCQVQLSHTNERSKETEWQWLLLTILRSIPDSRQTSRL